MGSLIQSGQHSRNTVNSWLGLLAMAFLGLATGRLRPSSLRPLRRKGDEVDVLLDTASSAGGAPKRSAAEVIGLMTTAKSSSTRRHEAARGIRVPEHHLVLQIIGWGATFKAEVVLQVVPRMGLQRKKPAQGRLLTA